MKRKLALILALMLIACAALPVLAAGRAQGGYNPSAAHGEGAKAEFTVEVHDPALEINVWGELWFNAANEYYIANHEDDMFTISVTIPEGIDLSRCYIPSAYDGWLPVFFSELTYENGCYTYTGPIDSILTTGYNFTDIQVYVDQEYNPDEHWPDMIINVYATPEDVDSFCSEFEGAGWEYIDEPSTPTPVDPTPTPEAPTPTPELPTPEPEDPTPVPEDPTPEPGDPTPSPDPADPTPTPAPEDPDDPPKAGSASLIILGIAAIASAAGMAGVAVLKKRR